jgi:hypothetical protein
VKEELDRREFEAEITTVVLSNASQSKVDVIYQKMGLNAVVGDVPVPSHDFEPFNWNGETEPVGTPRACQHLETQLTSFGCTFGRNGYKVVDIHTKNNLLNFEDKRVGKLTGGSDVAIVPFKTATSGVKFQLCVLFELKTDGAVLKDGLEASFAQAKLELIAAWCLSHQQCMVVLTDITSRALVYDLTHTAATGGFQLIEYDCNLSQMAQLVTEFLSNSTLADATYIPNEGNPISEPKLAFKRCKLSPIDSLALDDFLMYGQFLPPGSKERCDMVSQFTCHPIDEYYHMYS